MTTVVIQPRAAKAGDEAAVSRLAGRVRHHSTNATAMIAIDSRKCAPTSHGFRWVSTVKPPSTACAGIPSNATVATRRSVCTAIATSQVAIAMRTSTKVSCRFVNSMIPWIAYCLVGVNDPSVQRGHVGHPSPEFDSRTAPPVTTTTTLAITDASAERRSTTTV